MINKLGINILGKLLNKDRKKLLSISYHFEREAKIMVGLFLAMIVVLFFAEMIGPWVLRQIDIDRCFDSGGTFDHKNRKCYYEFKDEKNIKLSPIELPNKEN